MIVVSNTSPIINLAQIEHLDLLHELFGTVLIPQAVYEEIAVAGSGQPGASELVALEWLEVVEVADKIS